MEIITNGEIKGGSKKIKKVNGEEQIHFKFDFVFPVSETDFAHFCGSNGSEVAFMRQPFPYKAMLFDKMNLAFRLSIIQLDNDGDELGEEREFVDVQVNGFKLVNLENIPTLTINFVVPTIKNLIEGLFNLNGKVNMKMNF
jgi:hypothetical protein